MRGDGESALSAVPAATQSAALEALLRALRVDELRLPESVIEIIPPRPVGFGRHRELFPRNTGPMFDRVSPAAMAADLVVASLLEPTRAARLIEQHAGDESLPGLLDVVERLLETTFAAVPSDGYEAELQRVVQRVIVERLMRLGSVSPMGQVRAVSQYWLAELARRIDENRDRDAGGASGRAHAAALRRDIQRFFDSPGEAEGRWSAPSAPPGSPIGDSGLAWIPEPFCSQPDQPSVW